MKETQICVCVLRQTLCWTPALFPLARPVGNVSEIPSTLLMSVNMGQMVSDCSSGKRSLRGETWLDWERYWTELRLDRECENSHIEVKYTFTHEEITDTVLFTYYTQLLFCLQLVRFLIFLLFFSVDWF